jgi:hypothetical protein
MLIGVDFDNTIVCYDEVFYRSALERALISPGMPVTKSSVRNYLRQCDREDDWTELQGYVYGVRIVEATPFPGVIEFFDRCRERGMTLCIISHRTRYPFLGPPHDLHLAAQQWLDDQGFFNPTRIGLLPGQVYFELTKQAKLDRIAELGCDYFIDDLPEFLAEPTFPASVEPILFDPNNSYPADHRFLRGITWTEIEGIISGGREIAS